MNRIFALLMLPLALGQATLPDSANGTDGELVWVSEPELRRILAAGPPRDGTMDIEGGSWFIEGARAVKEGSRDCVSPPPPPIAYESATGADPLDQLIEAAQVAFVGRVFEATAGLFAGRPAFLLAVEVENWLLLPTERPEPTTVAVSYPGRLTSLAGIPICLYDNGWPDVPLPDTHIIVAAPGPDLNVFERIPLYPRGPSGVVVGRSGSAYMHRSLEKSSLIQNGMRFERIVRLIDEAIRGQGEERLKQDPEWPR